MDDEFDILSVVMPVSAVAFTAVCIWLTVRIVNRRERWAKWTLAAVVVLPMLYVASFGPTCWILSRCEPSDFHAHKLSVYRPLAWLCCQSGSLEMVMIKYGWFGMAEDYQVYIPVSQDESLALERIEGGNHASHILIGNDSDEQN